MNLTPDRQGYLGDIMTKSVSQLQELLDRQKKLLSKSKFIDSLPDKGEKTRQFAECIQELIDFKLKKSSGEKKDTLPFVSKVTQSSLSVNLKVESHQEIILPYPLSSSDKQNNDILSNIKSSKDLSTSKLENENGIRSKDEHNLDITTLENNDIVFNLEQMSLDSSDDKKCQTKDTYINSYEKIMKRFNEQPTKQTKFLPHRSLKHNEIPKSGENKKVKPPQKEEESAVKPPCYKFQETKLLSLDESVKLIDVQRTKNEQLAAEWAAKKLAEQLVPKMSAYLSSHIDMEYRDSSTKLDVKDSDDEDSQDEND